MKRDYAQKDDPKGAAKPVAPVAGLDDAPFRGYINLNLSDEQKENFTSWFAGSSPWERLETEVSSGVNISLKRDNKSGGFIASATQRSRGSVNAGLVVTARGRTASTAWGRCLFILAILSHNPSWETTQPMADPDRW